jgi:hypothetical protein
MRTITTLIKKIHIYIGLLNFSILLVFGVAGLNALLEGVSGGEPEATSERIQAFTAPANVSDREIASAVYEILKPPLTAPLPPEALARDKDSNLVLTFYSPNAITNVTVIEKAKQLRIRTSQNRFWRFLSNAHAATCEDDAARSDVVMKLWTYYTELSIWSLLIMPLSGVYLWLASRPKYGWAQIAFAGGCCLFIVLYVLAR